MALAAGVLEKSGVHLTFGGKSVGQGRDRTRDALLSTPELLSAVRAATIDSSPHNSAAPAPKPRRTKRRSAGATPTRRDPADRRTSAHCVCPAALLLPKGGASLRESLDFSVPSHYARGSACRAFARCSPRSAWHSGCPPKRAPRTSTSSSHPR